mgnify:FL=1|tara:strand:+ start:2775 stop:3212 length:438 start_codon:yes stop_codon:yes gene_type:complete
MSKLINIALSQYGVTEIIGYQHNPVVLNYFKEIGHTWVATDETAWCSSFVNWVALRANLERSHKLTARSWLNVGTAINQPKINDVVIFWRHKKSSWKGHVGFFIGYSEDKKYIYVLGGNQNNQVNIKKYPVYRLLGFRRLSTINP